MPPTVPPKPGPTTKPTVSAPTVSKPAVSKPVVSKPVVSKPAVSKPAVSKPPVGKPSTTKGKPAAPARKLTAAQKTAAIKALLTIRAIEDGKKTVAEAFGFAGSDVIEFLRVAARAYERGDFLSATDAAFVALSIDDANTDAWLLMGLSLAQRRRSDAARQAMQQVVAIDPKHIEAWVHLAEIEIADMQPQAAADALKKALALDPEARTPHGLRAQILVVESLSNDE